jgi:hypothetical protein
LFTSEFKINALGCKFFRVAENHKTVMNRYNLDPTSKIYSY